jgi:hypothetical protein
MCRARCSRGQRGRRNGWEGPTEARSCCFVHPSAGEGEGKARKRKYPRRYSISSPITPHTPSFPHVLARVTIRVEGIAGAGRADGGASIARCAARARPHGGRRKGADLGRWGGRSGGLALGAVAVFRGSCDWTRGGAGSAREFMLQRAGRGLHTRVHSHTGVCSHLHDYWSSGV